MKITSLAVYPIKGLRGFKLQSAEIGPLGIRYDRTFMLYETDSSTGDITKKIQIDSHPLCGLFEQQIIQKSEEEPSRILVTFHGSPSGESASENASDDKPTLFVPLEPDMAPLDKVTAPLHRSPTTAYRMGEPYDAWFSHQFGKPVALVYLGDGRRAVLGATLPPKPLPEQQQEQQQQGGGWFSAITSYLINGTQQSTTSAPGPFISFADVAPMLVTSEASLRDVEGRLLAGSDPNGGKLEVGMYKFRPNVVVDGVGEEPWAEDFWAELAIREQKGPTRVEPRGSGVTTLQLTGNCVRCVSLNVDYATGKPAEGELGNVLKRLMKERRVDTGSKWSPVFGRYAFLGGRDVKEAVVGTVVVSVGDEVEVTRRNEERSVWDWPGM
ncbi:uncharacterized protein C8A04DRAFT_31049 [Dichotomopilus funicola]|uniref:MOSC domain-containing protein n=1 Tax=Dichotomopilus funicola TaxID=1934379 RepID=A0AAN6UYG1_9PEZI|nr:hypothetical protein C8A04DRAFT_31049 [Dichotomopilus funicola]